jgi:glycine/D-amino acid oxidase-like deaminating enzyme/nitrite reductase/ring-hydroxylating ferredoxin subunit
MSQNTLDSPVWAESEAPPSQPPLTADTTVDVCVIGGGIAGLSVAYQLSLEGKSVVLLEAGRIANRMTRRTTAHLSSAIDDQFENLESVRGTEMAQLAYASHQAAVQRIGEIVLHENIRCDFTRVSGYLFNPPNGDRKSLEDEFAAAQRAEVAGVEMLDRSPLPRFDTGPCIHFPYQGQFDPLKYVTGLVRAIEKAGGRIHERTRVRTVESGESAKVVTESGSTVTAQSVVCASNAPVIDRVTLHTKQFPYVSYAVGLEVPRGAVPTALYWDTADPYHYMRLRAAEGDGPDELIVGGEDHKSGQDTPGDRFERLAIWARQRVPQCDRILHSWSGMVFETLDGLAYIGHNPGDSPNVYVATGDSGMGMTHGTIAGMLISDLIMGRDNPWTELYEPSRKPLRGVKGFAAENLNVATRYLEWVTTGDVSGPDQVPTGTGAVIRRGLHKVAIYRDDKGELHECSAACPHLGGVVHWNPAMRTWDCPLHGSRFDALGQVLDGPAIGGLAPVGESVPLQEESHATASRP